MKNLYLRLGVALIFETIIPKEKGLHVSKFEFLNNLHFI